jgi:hypothetical protein
VREPSAEYVARYDGCLHAGFSARTGLDWIARTERAGSGQRKADEKHPVAPAEAPSVRRVGPGRAVTATVATVANVGKRRLAVSS